jgi:phospholipase/lecithinase/hemolysin
MKILTPFVCLIVMSLIWPKIAPGQMRNLDRFQKLIVFGDSLPDISLTPAVIARGGPTVYAAKHFVDTANNLLAVQVHLAASNYLVHANVVDINSLFTELVTEPTDFGFKNSVQAAFNPNTGKVVRDPNDFIQQRMRTSLLLSLSIALLFPISNCLKGLERPLWPRQAFGGRWVRTDR